MLELVRLDPSAQQDLAAALREREDVPGQARRGIVGLAAVVGDAVAGRARVAPALEDDGGRDDGLARARIARQVGVVDRGPLPRGDPGPLAERGGLLQLDARNFDLARPGVQRVVDQQPQRFLWLHAVALLLARKVDAGDGPLVLPRAELDQHAAVAPGEPHGLERHDPFDLVRCVDHEATLAHSDLADVEVVGRVLRPQQALAPYPSQDAADRHGAHDALALQRQGREDDVKGRQGDVQVVGLIGQAIGGGQRRH
mmetsp:Transcript_97746/g.298660  ORF Transcript_97746/g.298660 Transcript_97746/m.298660 type:complete len:256 (-) Transcript_97746:2005-2772(-)